MTTIQTDAVTYLLTGLFQIAIIVGVSWGFAIVVTSNHEPATPKAVEVTCTSCSCGIPTKSVNISGGAL